MASGRALARDAGLRVLEARGAVRERDFAFGIARQLFEQTVGTATEAERRALLAGAAGLSGRLVGDAGPEVVAQGADTAFAALHGLALGSDREDAGREIGLAAGASTSAETPRSTP